MTMPHTVVFEQAAEYWFVSPDGKFNYSLGYCDNDDALAQAVTKAMNDAGPSQGWDGWETTRNIPIVTR
jgi:hypothetical protein